MCWILPGVWDWEYDRVQKWTAQLFWFSWSSSRSYLQVGSLEVGSFHAPSHKAPVGSGMGALWESTLMELEDTPFYTTPIPKQSPNKA